MATPTLANSLNFHSSPTVLRPFVPPGYPKPQPQFFVFPTGKERYPWRIVALATNRTVSRHNSLPFAVRKCTRLNGQLKRTKPDPLKIALSGFPDVNTSRAYYQGAGDELN